ncbi:hypothetical protein TrLO_g11428 [Triparma laevis f. longispina]|uniref:Rubredoxin-like domain-containing protein n=1 Tax=Triparma laevis f. longispina TaxID=1714387 RepID=A0A9W6ZS62_9STRA|nr:hypothetical protein TrLO_g11428 [Triparma laevis f. longispina]
MLASKLAIALLHLFLLSATNSFMLSPTSTLQSLRSTTSLNFFGAKAPPPGTPVDYVCKDCGYVFTKGEAAWEKLPKSYACPPCGAPKFRFNTVAKGTGPKKVEVKKSWF